MQNFSDHLIAIIRKKNSCVVVGLDPHFKLIPDDIKQKFLNLHKPSLEYAARVILEFNIQVIDIITPYVGIVKPQIAFYELYGWWGIWAYAETLKYAKHKGLIVIGAVKQGDLQDFFRRYAEATIGAGHIDNIVETSFASDAIT